MTLGTVLLRFERRAAVYGLITLGDVLTSSLLSILAVYVLHSGISGMLWALALSKIFWSGVCYLPLRGSLRFTLRRAEAKEILAYGLPLVPAVLVGWAQTYANRFVMVSSLSFAEIGIYSLAVKVASGITIVDTAFRLAWDPYAVSIMGDPDARDKYARMLDIYVVVMVGICAVVGALGPVLVKLLSTPAYFMAGRLVGFIAMALLWTGILQILLLGIGVVRKTYLGAFGFSIGVCVNITLLMSTLKANGIIAVCYSYLAGSIVTALIILYIGQRNYYIPYRYSTIFLTILGAIFIAGYNYLFGDIMPGDMTGLLSKSLFNLTVALLLASVMFCLVITKQDKRNVKLYLFSMLNK